MKKIAFACGLLLILSSTTIIASTTFADKKKNVLDLVGKRIQILMAYKDCVEGSNSKDGMRECKRSQKSSLKKLRLDSRERKRMERTQRIEQKAKLQ